METTGRGTAADPEMLEITGEIDERKKFIADAGVAIV